jgi:Domain of unknown function (DUF397)
VDEHVLSHAVWRKSSHSGQNGNCVEAAVLGGAMWRKSSHSGTKGNCVEAAALDGATWHKSSHSGANGNCVEAARHTPGVVAVRDSKDPAGPALAFSPHAWQAFTARIRTCDLA